MSTGDESITRDTDLPPPKAAEGAATQRDHQQGKTPHHINPTKKIFLSLRQLNCLALIIVLSSCGLVSLEYFAFLLFPIIYTFFLSKFAFPLQPLNPNHATQNPQIFSRNDKVFRIYLTLAGIIGLYLPIVYIFVCIYEGDKEGVKIAASHLFLVASQLFVEGVAFNGGFTIPTKAFVFILYNSKRVVETLEWLRSEMVKGGGIQEKGSEWRLIMARAVAVANLMFWSFNLFGFFDPCFRS